MNTHNARKTFSIVIFAAAMIVGCDNNVKPFQAMNDGFTPDDQPRAMDAMYAQQTANGARQDGTLYAMHFTDGQLNSLGYRKLASMVYGPENGKLTVYLSIPNDASYNACESSVTTYLTQKGLSSSAYTITAGPNPTGGSPAVQGLSGLVQQEKSDGGGGDNSASTAMAGK